ncbi:MAG: hypothetical protein OEY08_19295 [Gammaproteobacteria bacterium]|nr:hypothetical protein [Gammaproteobacteria bacterium]
MSSIEASAPGKVVISGEYAVLHGGAAIAAAVSRRARVTVTRNGADIVSVTAPGYLPRTIRGQPNDDGRLHWIDSLPAPGALHLVECVWKRTGGSRHGGLDICLDTRDFVDAGTGEKLGLGSSAALAVALAAALMAAGEDGTDVLGRAQGAHREFQDGRGSGIDVATAFHGGVIAFRRESPVRPCAWVDGLAWRLLWSGRSASTAMKLARLDASSRKGVDELVATADAVTAAWQHRAAGDVLQALSRFSVALERYGVDHDLGIFEAGHRSIADLAGSRRDLLFKPCGAGGGDIGIVLGTSRKAVDRFAADAAARGFAPLDVELDPVGLSVRESPG